MMFFYEKMSYEQIDKLDSVLSSIQLFKNLSPSNLRYILFISHIKNYNKGEVIISKEEKNSNLYILLEGKVAIYPDQPELPEDIKPLYLVKKNEPFGEISLINNSNRIATAVSETDSKVIEINGRKMKDFMDNNIVAGYKILLNITKSISKRLSNTNRQWDDLNHVNEKINSKKTEKETFYRIASHEIKSPISGMSAILKTINHVYKDNLDPKILDLIKSAEKKGDNAIKVINDLFLLSEDNNREDEYRSCDVIDAIKKVLSNEDARINEKGIGINANFNYKNNPEINSFNDDIYTIFSNIISNSIRYSYRNSNIIIKNFIVDGHYCISIKDEGIGISREDIKKIGKDFFRSINAKKYNNDGTGLGMSIVHKLITRYKGKMEINSELGKWTEFIIKFNLKNN